MDSWTYVLLMKPDGSYRMKSVPLEEPEPRIAINRVECEDEDPIVYTLIGRDNERREAYYFVGEWGFGEKPPMSVNGPIIEA